MILIRQRTSDEGTFGTLWVMETNWTCATAELPWRENKCGRSCIPRGAYEATFLPRSASGKFKNVYHVQNVVGRSGILIHAGNFAGDVNKGLKSDVDGCILVGQKHGVLNGQQVVLSSRLALKELVKQLGDEPAKLYIWDLADVG